MHYVHPPRLFASAGGEEIWSISGWCMPRRTNQLDLEKSGPGCDDLGTVASCVLARKLEAQSLTASHLCLTSWLGSAGGLALCQGVVRKLVARAFSSLGGPMERAHHDR